MTDNTPRAILSVCATVKTKLPDLPIKEGNLIFVQDKHKVALDFNGKRVFYNDIEDLQTEGVRQKLLAPIVGRFYFVIDTAVLWNYTESGWVQVTTPPEEIVFIGTELPELGVVQTLYVNKAEREILVWDAPNNEYLVVADKSEIVSTEDIDALFA